MSDHGAFVKQLMREGCRNINMAQTISGLYPPVWKWFVYRWIFHQGTPKEFFKQHLPTQFKKHSFMRKLAEHGIFSILQWAYLNGCEFDEFDAHGWFSIADRAKKGGNMEIAAWARRLGQKFSFVPPVYHTVPRRGSRKKRIGRMG